MASSAATSTSLSKANQHLPVEQIMNAADKYPKPQGIQFSYGTAGFRTKAAVLPSVLFRIGLLATLRSKKLDGRCVGVMITASHNPEEDNGAKLVDPHGEMLEASWESHATTISNAETTSDLLSALTTFITALKIDLSKPSCVVYGRDTRPSGPELVEALEAGLQSMRTGLKTESGAHLERWDDRGVVTTPVLHYIVRGLNLSGKSREEYGEPTFEGYLLKMADAFCKLMSGKPQQSPLVIDCANGVGTLTLTRLAPMIRKYLEIEPVCTAIDTLGTLNANCGADYVKTGQRAPPAVLAELAKTADASSAASRRACSIDGDADRVIYYYLTANGGKEGSEGKFRLLDGDKIATLAAGFIGDLVRTAGLEGQIKLGVVQTAYANGSSTAYLKGVNVPVKCVPTGVKHLHHAAERYDVGVYFEANGHGTVIFSPETLALLFSHEPKTPNQSTALTTLQSLTHLINQAVGDAVSDLLFVEVILALKKWGPEDWDAVYEDLPNRLVKVNVKDRSVFKTEDAERRLIEPAGLQAKVDEKVRMFEKGRSFVRPSGTEDCVRVYAEASTKVAADDLALQVSQLVSDFSNSLP